MAKFVGDELERIELTHADEWWEWLSANHLQSASVWVVTFKKHVPEWYVATTDLIDAALAFGWIDSLPRRLDEDRTMLRFSPRKAGSAWSLVNKQKIERLFALGKMRPSGIARIEEAKADGSWERIDQAGLLEEPDDLQDLFSESPEAKANWDRFPPSTRRAILEWILQARTDATRQKRIAETVEKAERGIRANQWSKS